MLARVGAIASGNLSYENIKLRGAACNMNCISVQFFDCSQMKLLFCIRFLLVVLLDLLGLSFFSPIMVNFTVMGGGGLCVI